MPESRIGDPYSRGVGILRDGLDEACDQIRTSTARSQRLMRDLASEAEVRANFKASGLKALEALEKLGQIDEENRNSAVTALHAARADGSVMIDGDIHMFVTLERVDADAEAKRAVRRGGI